MADSSGTNPNSKTTVLLVEDDEPLLELCSIILRREGYEVITAPNGREALEIAKSQPDKHIDVLLSDVAMPYMGGVQLALNLREMHPGIRVLLTSAIPFHEISNQCGPTFHPDFLAKPFTVADLRDKVKVIVESL